MPKANRSDDHTTTTPPSTTTSRSSLAERIATTPELHSNSNPLWQGPCGEGPNGGVTQSMLARFFSCRERFRLKYILGLEPLDKWHHRFGYGNMWHVCEEALAAGIDPALRLGIYASSQMTKYPLQREEIEKWGSVCATQFPEYVKYWSEHPDVLNRTPLMQEQNFDVPYTLPSGRVVRLRGRWDSVDLITDDLTGPMGGIYLQENKTKGDIDPIQVERQLKFDLQTMLYIIALDHSAVEEDDRIPILGVRYNVVRRPLSGGKGNISPHKAKSTKTKFTPAESAEQFYERLRRDYIAKEPSYWFFRVRAEISQHDIEVFKKTCLDPLLEHLCVWYEQTTDRWDEDHNPDAVVYGSSAIPPLNYRTPFGIYNSLSEDGATEYDAYLATGSEAGLRRVNELFTELK